MDVSYTNVLEVSRQYFQGLPVPSTAGAITLTENLTTTTSTSFENGTSTTTSSITTPAVASMVTTSNNRDQQVYSETKAEESSTSYWNPSGSNELRPVEPYPPQPTKVEVPDTRPEEASMEPGSSTLTEMLPSKPRSTEQKQEPSSTVPATDSQLHQMQPPKSQSPAPIYQQLNSVARNSYPSADPHTSYQNDRSTSSSSIAQRNTVQYYPRYHHPDIRKSAPVPFSQNSMYQPTNTAPTNTVQCIRSSNEQGPMSVPTSSHSQQDQHRVPPYSQTQTLVGGPSVYGASPQNHYTNTQRRSTDGHSSSANTANSLVNPQFTSNPIATGSTSHIPSPHNIPAHIPSPHPPSISPSAHQLSSRNVPQTYSARPIQNATNYNPQSSHEIGHHTSASRHSPQVPVLQATPSPNNFQPHSPPYPPPSRSTPQSYPPTSQHYQTASNYPNPYQSSYHSFQKTLPTQHSNYYSQTGRVYPQQVESIQSGSTTGSNGAYQNSLIKPTTYNGADVKRNPAEVANYGSYRAPTPVQRPGNTHNLPPIGNLSFQNRNSRDPISKSQAVPRQRPQVSKPMVPPNSTMPAPRRVAEYPVGSSSMNHVLPINGRTTNVTTSYSRYQGNQGAYPTYATTVAPSHYGSNSSSTTVTSVGMSNSRPSAPTHSANQYPSSDTTARTANYSGVPRTQENIYKDYYPNSSRYSTTLPITAQPQSNGLPVRKRESPLDLSVKTVKTSADSTAQDDEASMDKHVSSSNAVSSRNVRSMLPPAQPFGFDARNTNGTRNNIRPSTPHTVCAPKVEFYPDFNSTPLRHAQPKSDNSLRRSLSQQIYVPPQQNTVPLPHMSTFKKSSLPSAQYDPKTPLYDKTTPYDNKPSPYHSSDPALARSSRYPPALDPSRSIPDREFPRQEVPSESSKYYLDSRGKFFSSQLSDKLPTKRPADTIYGGPSPNKQPRVDAWRLAIDEQIQQKFMAARHEEQKRQEMNVVPNGTYDPRPENNPYSSESARYQAFCDKRNYQDTKVPRSSSSSYSQSTPRPSNLHSLPQPSGSQIDYLYRHNQRMPYNPEPPSNTGADKRVLSLLRNSLESKQQREEQLNSQQMVNHSQQSFQNKVVTPVEPKTNIGRHNLSPFTAASLLERNSNTPPHYKFHVPKAVDSITQDGTRLYGSKMNSTAIKETSLSPRGLENMIRDKDDGLAAKIRTKAELKQVGTGQFVSKPPVLMIHDAPSTPKELEGAASTSTLQTSGSSVGSPPKLTREKSACLPPRRRLFSRTDDENMIIANVPVIATASTVSPRASGFRSSSETSVFDFRESDSEGEMPVLERQTLEEMRRDRKQLSKVQPPVPLNDVMLGMTSSTDLVKIELKENDKITEMDPFWTATCDKFMEQLRNGDSVKKRGRKKKTECTATLKAEVTTEESIEPLAPIIKPEDIKQEAPELEVKEIQESKKEILSPVEIKTEPKEEQKEKEEKKEQKEEEEEEVDEKVEEKFPRIEIEKTKEKNSGDDSDEVPLIRRAKKKKKLKKEDSDQDEEIVCRKNRVRRGSRIKLESSSGSESSSEESDASTEFGQGSSVADRLRARKRSGKSKSNEGMKLRSRGNTPHKGKQEKETTKSPKGTPNKTKPKPLFGDGSDFRPGWEEEVYVYKKSLRMPPRLITVSKPTRFHRLSTSLPDLDPGSPALSVSMDSTDVCLNRKRLVDSDLESNCSFGLLGSKIDDEEATSSTTISCPPKTRFIKMETNSIVDVLAQKVGTTKTTKKSNKEKVDKSPFKLNRRSNNEPELLPTPSLTPLLPEESSKSKTGKTPIKNNKSPKPIKVSDSFLLGYFRKETVNNFRSTFKNNHALPNEFSTVVLKSRTRTETRVLKKQATIREVFGEDRPASAPPIRNHGDTSQDDDSQNESQSGTIERSMTLKQKVVSRLRNVGILGSNNKAIINSRRHLLIAKRKKDFIDKTVKEVKKEIEDDDEDDEEEDDEEEEQNRDEIQEREINEPGTDNNDESLNKKKFRTGRRKFRSGFDYIRKKKKPMKKDDILPKERKRPTITKSNPECVADIQNEIRTWVIKKGVGETILHRAARLGYTDVAAFCLEKLNNIPSPKDNAGYTPLHEACAKGHLEIAKLLLAYGANVSESANGGIRPLHEAAENGSAELVRLLLSYGADPLLATYAGQTPLMLASDTDAHTILQQHLNDIQGRDCEPWSFGGPSSVFDPEESGYNPLENIPVEAPKLELEEIEMEVSDINLPALFTLNNDPDKWILLQDLMTAVKVKSRDALLRQINPKAPSGPPNVAHRDVMKDMKLGDFLEQSRCCHLLSGGEKINVRGSKVTLIKYNDKVKSLLNVERILISTR
ncbi:uncharacterized protein LOC122504527 [Leptopilina heterotoma]|uniref:uncharacterized protein LOC122504527 n=1 Tax=Leptopilina heterotoma TaxID=63436 RepID=UPI001CA80A9A|nr:uncharacterized protein LOC122504527 [Leptopilina heterotoma]